MRTTSHNSIGAFCAFLVLGTACFSQESTPPSGAYSYLEAEFPELKPVGELPGSMEWTFQDGPDFYVYRAVSKENSLLGLGFYFGYFPSPHHPDFTESQPGEVAGAVIAWRTGLVESDGSTLLLREAIFDYPPHGDPARVSNPLQIHVWANADSEAGMNSLVLALRKLSFEELNSRSDHLKDDVQ